MKSTKKFKIVKLLKIMTILVVGLVVGLGVFIKVDTPAAAEFTDNVLRPVLGNRPVIFLEKVFYNFSDKITQLSYGHGKSVDPGFLEQGGSNFTDSNLNLSSIKPLPNLTPLTNEGVWMNKSLKMFPNKEVMAFTFIRPDPDRPYAVVTLIQADMKQLQIGSVAGTRFPGGPVGKPGPGVVPPDIIKSGSLIAAFDGGFQYRDGQYGMVVGNTTYLPLKPDIATAVGYKEGGFKIVDYTGQNLGTNIAFIRQNCPILINNGVMEVTNPKNKALWGRTMTADIYTWRSGMGITKEGNLIYAVGNNLTPTTLATALKMAGAESAMQLDINPYWVRFNIFDSIGNGKYATTTLNKNLQDGSKQYLNGYQKDFFYLYKK